VDLAKAEIDEWNKMDFKHKIVDLSNEIKMLSKINFSQECAECKKKEYKINKLES